jgi:hypothetical protein
VASPRRRTAATDDTHSPGHRAARASHAGCLSSAIANAVNSIWR